MIIINRTAYSLTRLLLCSFAAGVALYLIFLLLVSLPRIIMRADAVKDGFAAYRQSIAAHKSNKALLAICDFTVCVIAACAACALFFLYNDGQFRLISIAVWGLGLYCGKSVLSGSLRFLIEIISFVSLKLLFIVSFPAAWSIGLLMGAIRRARRKTLNIHRISLMKKHTKEKFDKLDGLTEFGLVDKGYKELIK